MGSIPARSKPPSSSHPLEALWRVLRRRPEACRTSCPNRAGSDTGVADGTSRMTVEWNCGRGRKACGAPEKGSVAAHRYRNGRRRSERIDVSTAYVNSLRPHYSPHKVKDRGSGLRRFPSADLYGRYRLYKVPAVAGWRSAHASGEPHARFDEGGQARACPLLYPFPSPHAWRRRTDPATIPRNRIAPAEMRYQVINLVTRGKLGVALVRGLVFAPDSVCARGTARSRR